MLEIEERLGYEKGGKFNKDTFISGYQLYYTENNDA